MKLTCKKVKYATKKAAEDFILVLKKKKEKAELPTAMASYKCTICNVWHITTVFSESIDLNKYKNTLEQNKQLILKNAELKSLINELKQQTNSNSLEGTMYQRLVDKNKQLTQQIKDQRKTIDQLICRIAKAKI